MLASNRDPSARDSLPVCLSKENSNRLVGLWDIVNQFNAPDLMIVMQQLGGVEGKFKVFSKMGKGNRRIGEHYDAMIKDLKWAKDRCSEAGFFNSWRVIDLALENLKRPDRADLSM